MATSGDHSGEPSQRHVPPSSSGWRRLVRIPPAAWPVLGAFAIFCVALFLASQWKEAVEPRPLGPAGTFVLSGEDWTLEALADEPGSPVGVYQTSPPIYRLQQNLDIHAAGRLLIEGDILLIDEDLTIEVNGTLLVWNSTILDFNSSAGTWEGIIVHPTGQLDLNGSMVQGGDPLVTVHDPAGDLSERFNLERSELAPAGRGVVVDDAASGGWLSHQHVARINATDIWYVNATVHEFDPSGASITWTVDDVSATANSTLPLAVREPGLHIVRSEARDSAEVLLGRGVSLLLIVEDVSAAGWLDIRTVDPLGQPPGTEFDVKPAVVDLLESSTMASDGRINTSSATQLVIDDMPGRVTVWSNLTGHASHMHEYHTKGYDGGEPATQFVIARAEGERWLGAHHGAGVSTHQVLDETWVPDILQGDVLDGDLNRTHHVAWSSASSLVTSNLSNTTDHGRSALPLDGYTGATICPTDAGGSVLHRWVAGENQSTVAWNTSSSAWDDVTTPWHANVSTHIDLNRTFLCIDDGVFDLLLLQQFGNGSQRQVQVVRLVDEDVDDEYVFWWPDLGIKQAMVAQVSGDGDVELARIAYGMPPVSSLNWFDLPDEGANLSSQNISSADDPEWEFLFAPHPAIPSSPNLASLTRLDPGGPWVPISVELQNGTVHLVDPPFNPLAHPAAAACDFDLDGVTEVIAFSVSGSWSMWTHNVSDPQAAEPLPGNWTQQSAGLLPDRLGGGVVASACLEASSEHGPLLILGLTTHQYAVLTPARNPHMRGSEQLESWTMVDMDDPRMAPMMPRQNWLGYGEWHADAWLDLTGAPDTRLLVSTPRWRAGPGDVTVDIALTGVPLTPASCGLMLDGEPAGIASGWHDPAGDWSAELTVELTSIKPYTLELDCDTAGARWGTVELVVGVMTPSLWSQLNGTVVISDTTIAAVDAAIDLSGAVTLTFAGLTIQGDPTNGTEPLIVSEGSILSGDDLTMDDHAAEGIVIVGGDLILNSVSARNLAVVLEATGANVTLSDASITNNRSGTIRGINVTASDLIISGLSATNITRLFELDASVVNVSEVRASDVGALGWLHGSASAALSPSLVNWTTTGDHADGTPGLDLAWIDAGTFSGLVWNVTDSTSPLIVVEDSALDLENSTLLSNATLVAATSAAWIAVTDSALERRDGGSALVADGDSHIGLLDTTLASGLPDVRDTDSHIHSQVWIGIEVWTTLTTPPATANVSVESAEQDRIELSVAVRTSRSQPDAFPTQSEPVLSDRSRAGLRVDAWRWDGADNHTRVPPPLWFNVTHGAGTSTGVNLTPTVNQLLSVHLGGDMDLDGRPDRDEGQVQVTDVALSTGHLALDLQAADGHVHVLGDDEEVRFGVPRTAEDLRLWVRARSADGASGCVNVKLVQVAGGGNETAGPHCLHVDGRQRWLPGPLTDASARDARYLAMIVDSLAVGAIAVDRVLLVSDDSGPVDPFNADIDGDQLLDGLEDNWPSGFSAIMPDDTRGQALVITENALFGHAVHFEPEHTVLFPTPSEAAELWVHGSIMGHTSHALRINDDKKTHPVELVGEADGWWQVHDATTDDPYLIGAGDRAELLPHSELMLDAIWTRAPRGVTFTDFTTSRALGAGNNTLEIQTGRVAARSRLHLAAEPAVLAVDFAGSDSLIAVDDLTDETWVLDPISSTTCSLKRYDATLTPHGWWNPLSCSQPLTAFAAGGGWMAWASEPSGAGAGSDLHVKALNGHPEAFLGQQVWNGAMVGTVLSLGFSNGRLLVETDSSWYLWERFGDAGVIVDLGDNSSVPTSPFQMYNHARGIHDGSLDMDACLMNDLLFGLITNGSARDLVVGVVSTSEPLATSLPSSVLNGSANTSLLQRWEVHSTWNGSASLSCGRHLIAIREGDDISVLEPTTGQEATYDVMSLTSAELSTNDRLIIDDGTKKVAELIDRDGTLLTVPTWHDLGVHAAVHVAEGGAAVPNGSDWNWLGVEATLGTTDTGDLRTLHALWLDHAVELDGALADRLLNGLGSTLLGYGVLSTSAVVTITTDDRSTLAIHPDSDGDGLDDGDELGWWAGPSQVIRPADATVNAGCHDHVETVGLDTRWSAEPWIQLADQCRVIEGLALHWSPLRGTGGHVSWGLETEAEGPHRLEIETGPALESRTVTPLELVDGNVSNVHAASDDAGGQPNPEFVDVLLQQTLDRLFTIEVTDSSGAALKVLDDGIWVEADTMAWNRQGGWTLAVRYGGTLEVDVETPGRIEVHLRFGDEGTRILFHEMMMMGIDRGLSNFFTGVLSTPVTGIAWGPIGALDPLLRDSDGDSLEDGVDRTPYANDIDRDGLTDAQEAVLGTDPADRDTDHDSLWDGIEVQLSHSDGGDCVESAEDWVADRADRSRAENGTAPRVVGLCPGVEVDGTASWLHRRAAGHLLDLSTFSRLDANNSSWTEPLDPDTDDDGLPDGWIDGWTYAASLADVGISAVDQASGAAAILELAGLGAYDESRWMQGNLRDGLAGADEGEDVNLDGDISTDTTSGEWGMESEFHLPTSVRETDNLEADGDGDGLPDGWEILTSAFFADRHFTDGLQDPTIADGLNDDDLTAEEWTDELLTSSAPASFVGYWGHWIDTNGGDPPVHLLPIELPLGSSDTRCTVIDWIRFPAIDLPTGTTVAIVSTDLPDQPTQRWSLDGADWAWDGNHPIQFMTPWTFTDELVQVALAKPLSCAALERSRLLIRLPPSVTRGWMGAGPAELEFTPAVRIGTVNNSSGDNLLHSWADWAPTWHNHSSGVDWKVPLAIHTIGERTGDGVPAWVEYAVGTLPTRFDSDAGRKATATDLSGDRAEIAPLDNGTGPLDLTDVPIRWITTVPLARLGWRFAVSAGENDVFALSEPASWNTTRSDHAWTFTWNATGLVNATPFDQTGCGDPGAMLPYARLDDGSWMAVNASAPADPEWLCIFHPATHWDEPETWESREALGIAFRRDTSAAVTDAIGDPSDWTLNTTRRHQFGLEGAPFLRDADGDGLVDGLEGDSGWDVDHAAGARGEAPFHAWKSAENVSRESWWNDTDGDHIADAWDPDADGDGVLDGHEVGWLIDLDGDGLPGHMDEDSDADGRRDGVEFLPEHDTDGDGIGWDITIATGESKRVELGGGALDADSDNDGLLDGCLDDAAWNETGTPTVITASIDSGLGLSLSSHEARVWKPAPLQHRRLAGQGVFTTVDASTNTALHFGLFADSTGTGFAGCDPWEGEERDGREGHDFSAGDLNPIRNDTDGDGLLDGPASLYAWASNWTSGADEDGPWAGYSGNRSDVPRALARLPQGSWLPPLEETGHLIWGRAGEVIGPFTARRWWPHLPSGTHNASADHAAGDDVDCPFRYDNLSLSAYRDQMELRAADAWPSAAGICFDLLWINETTQSMVGWSNGSVADTDDDGLDDAGERLWRNVSVAPMQWEAWLDDSGGAPLVDHAWFHTSGDPWINDTDGDGILDGIEAARGWAIDDLDTDRDGLSDADEDLDGDGIVDDDETDPRMMDSDGDGLPDGPTTISWTDTTLDFAEDNRVFWKPMHSGCEFTGAQLHGEWHPPACESEGAGSAILADTDGDGMSDGAEVAAWSAWTRYWDTADAAGDDTAAGRISTIRNMDSDDDGLWDGAEMPLTHHFDLSTFDWTWITTPTSLGRDGWWAASTDPFDGDSEGSGDGEGGTDDRTAGDGLADSWEPFPWIDTDRDGNVNGRDVRAYTSGDGAAQDRDGARSHLLARQLSATTWAVRDVTVGQDGNYTLSAGTTDWESAGESTVTSPPPGAKALRHPHMCVDGATGCNASSALLLGSELSVLKENGELDVIRYAIVGADHHLYIPRVDNWTRLMIDSTTSAPDTTIAATLTIMNSIIDARHALATDRDFDGLQDAAETNDWGTGTLDRDSDDDGVLDGLDARLCVDAASLEWPAALVHDVGGEDVADPDGDGLLCPLDPDSDGDGLRDGTELGITEPVRGISAWSVSGTDPGAHTGGNPHFSVDADPTTRTDPLLVDSDGDGVPDGWLDHNHDLSWTAPTFWGVAGEYDALHQQYTTDAQGATANKAFHRFSGEGTHIDAFTDGTDAYLHGIITLTGGEDLNANGRVDAYELDPLDSDSDDDGMPDGPSHQLRDALWDAWPHLMDSGSTTGQLYGTEQEIAHQMLATCAGENWTRALVLDDTTTSTGTPVDQMWQQRDFDQDGTPNALDRDADGDRLPDGLECGVTQAILELIGFWEVPVDAASLGEDELVELTRGTNASRRNFTEDLDPSSLTDPWDWDTDDDGMSDGQEDRRQDGINPLNETDPLDHDTDGDGLTDFVERGRILEDIPAKVRWMVARTTHRPHWSVSSAAMIDTFEEDADEGLTFTDPLKGDTDGDGHLDGDEDLNGDGMLGAWIVNNTTLSTNLGWTTSQLDAERDGWECDLGVFEAERDDAGRQADPASWTSACELDPANPDSDGDGVFDGAESRGWEVVILSPDYDEAKTRTWWTTSNPFRSDTDNDGALDGEEYNHRIDARRADSDGDWLPDGWEIDNNGSANMIETTPPDIHVDRNGFGFDIGLKWTDCIRIAFVKVCTKVWVTRDFDLKLKVTDAAGVMSAKLWIIEGEYDTSGGVVVPGHAVDAVALARAASDQERANGGLSALTNPSSYPVPTMGAVTRAALQNGQVSTQAAFIGVDQGLRRSVIWHGTLTTAVKVSASSALPGSDIWDLFAGYSIVVVASDVNGNEGNGSVDFPSLAGAISAVAEAIWQSLVSVFSVARDALAQALEAAGGFVMQMARGVIENVLKPLFNAMMSALPAVASTVDFLADLVAYAVGLDIIGLLTDYRIQEAFGAVVRLLGGYNGETHTIPVWISAAMSMVGVFVTSAASQLKQAIVKVKDTVMEQMGRCSPTLPNTLDVEESDLEFAIPGVCGALLGMAFSMVRTLPEVFRSAGLVASGAAQGLAEAGTRATHSISKKAFLEWSLIAIFFGPPSINWLLSVVEGVHPAAVFVATLLYSLALSVGFAIGWAWGSPADSNQYGGFWTIFSDVFKGSWSSAFSAVPIVQQVVVAGGAIAVILEIFRWAIGGHSTTEHSPLAQSALTLGIEAIALALLYFGLRLDGRVTSSSGDPDEFQEKPGVISDFLARWMLLERDTKHRRAGMVLAAVASLAVAFLALQLNSPVVALILDFCGIVLLGIALGLDAVDHVISGESASWGVGIWLGSVGISMFALTFELHQLTRDVDKIIVPWLGRLDL